MKFIIRDAEQRDVEEIVVLCTEHASYEKTFYSAAGKAEKLIFYLFSESPELYCLIAENPNGIIGYSTYMFEFSAWDAAYYLHMDCLYLRSAARGTGIGTEMIKEIARRAKSKGCIQVQWQTPVSNEKAIQFYYSIGAGAKEKLRFYMNEQAMNSFIAKKDLLF